MDLSLYTTNENKGLVRSSSLMMTFGIAFFIWGFLPVLNTVFLMNFRAIFDIGYSFSTLIGIAFYAAYLVVSLIAGRMVRNSGYKLSLIVGLYITGIACMLLHFAFTVDNYYFFLFSFFLQAVGITCLQVAANLYIVFMGDPAKAPSRLCFMLAFNSLGAVLAPLIDSGYVTGLIAPMEAALGPAVKEMMDSMMSAGMALPDSVMNYMELSGAQSSSWERLIQISFVQFPYIIISILLFLLTIFFVFVDIPEYKTEGFEPLNKRKQSSRRLHVMHFRQLRLGAFAIFAYIGAEVALSHILESDIFKMALADKIDIYPSTFYWGAAMIGRFIGAVVLLRVPPAKVLLYSVAVSLLMLMVIMISEHRFVELCAISMIGLFNATMFPIIFCLAINGIGKFSEHGAAIITMANVGGGVIPFMTRNYSLGLGLEYGIVIVIVCYAYIMYYSLDGSKFEIRDDLKGKVLNS